LRLYSYPDNYRVWKIQVAAALSGVDVEIPAFEFGKDNKTEEFKAKFPTGKVPALDTPNGPLFESFAILRYIARLRPESGLYGQCFWGQTLVDQWLDYASNEFEAARNIWLYPIYGVTQYDERAYQGAKKDVLTCLGVFNTHLANNSFFVGNSITIADISIAAALVGLYSTVLAPAVVSQFGNVRRWFDLIVNQPLVHDVFGKVEFCAVEKVAEKKKADKKESKEKPEKKTDKKEKKETTEKPKEDKPAAKSNADLLDELEKPQKKEKNPLDLLPPSPMVFDVVKKSFFSEKPYNPKFWNEFWPQFDAAGYSLYFCDYKDNAENKVYFMTCNLIGGFLQRVEDLRKYGMGAINLYGVNDEIPPFKINGAWIFRGVGIPKEMSECPDSESYTWTVVDPKDAAQRTKFEKRFCADDVGGSNDEKCFERKYFK
jgi:elongation factor 1-gamma